MESLYDFLEMNDLYVVMLIVLIVWIGIFTYMFSIDKKIKKIEESKAGSENE